MLADVSNTKSEISNLLNAAKFRIILWSEVQYNGSKPTNQLFSQIKRSLFRTLKRTPLLARHKPPLFFCCCSNKVSTKSPYQQLTMKHFLLATILALCTFAVLAQATITTTLTATLNDDDSVTLVAYLNNTGSANVSTISSKFTFPGGRTYLQIGFSYASPSHSSVSSDIVSFIHHLVLLQSFPPTNHEDFLLLFRVMQLLRLAWMAVMRPSLRKACMSGNTSSWLSPWATLMATLKLIPIPSKTLLIQWPTPKWALKSLTREEQLPQSSPSSMTSSKKMKNPSPPLILYATKIREDWIRWESLLYKRCLFNLLLKDTQIYTTYLFVNKAKTNLMTKDDDEFNTACGWAMPWVLLFLQMSDQDARYQLLAQPCVCCKWISVTWGWYQKAILVWRGEWWHPSKPVAWALIFDFMFKAVIKN